MSIQGVALLSAPTHQTQTRVTDPCPTCQRAPKMH